MLLVKELLYPIRPAVKGLRLMLLPSIAEPIDSNFPAHADGKFYVHGAILMDFPKQVVGH